MQCIAAHICSLFIHSVWGAVLGDGCWIMFWSGTPATINRAARNTLPGHPCESLSEVCTSFEMT